MDFISNVNWWVLIISMNSIHTIIRGTNIPTIERMTVPAFIGVIAYTIVRPF